MNASEGVQEGDTYTLLQEMKIGLTTMGIPQKTQNNLPYNIKTNRKLLGGMNSGKGEGTKMSSVS